MDFTFKNWLESRDDVDEDQIKDAVIGAIPQKVKTAAGVSGTTPSDKEILLGKAIGVWEGDGGIINAILQQGAIKNALQPEDIEEIQQAVKQDTGNQLTFKAVLDMILQAAQSTGEESQPESPTPDPNQQQPSQQDPNAPNPQAPGPMGPGMPQPGGMLSPGSISL